jgi:hypothetical protein
MSPAGRTCLKLAPIGASDDVTKIDLGAIRDPRSIRYAFR